MAEPAHDTPETDAPEAHHDVREMGIEDEGIVTSDIFGIMLATVLSIACSVFGLYFLFFVTSRDHAREVAEDVPVERYVEQRELRAEAQDAYAHYALSPNGEGRYRIPIDAAMEIVERNATGGMSAPVTRTGFNLAWLNLYPAPAMEHAGSGGAPVDVATVAPNTTAAALPDVAPEEIVDEAH